MLDPALYWLIIGMVLFFLELALPGFVLFFFALGALVTALVAWIYPIGIAWQLGLFIIASLITLFALRNVIQDKLLSSDPDDEDGGDVVHATAGDKGVVIESIVPPAEGRIKYAGTYWRATADEAIEEGEIIAVVEQRDLIIHVEKV